MNMHQHEECEHELKYCSKCDVVYCEKCGKEWNSYTMTVGGTWYYPPNPYTYTVEGNTALLQNDQPGPLYPDSTMIKADQEYIHKHYIQHS